MANLRVSVLRIGKKQSQKRRRRIVRYRCALCRCIHRERDIDVLEYGSRERRRRRRRANERREETREGERECSLGWEVGNEGTSQFHYQSVGGEMARPKLISLSRVWYTMIVVLIHLILVYYGIKQCYFNDHLPWPRSSSSPHVELLIQKLCLLSSAVLLILFIYPALFRIGNFSNDQQHLTIDEIKDTKLSICFHVWHHCFSLSSTLHLAMSFLILLSTVLIHARQVTSGTKDLGKIRSVHEWERERGIAAGYIR